MLAMAWSQSMILECGGANLKKTKAIEPGWQESLCDGYLQGLVRT